MQPTSIDKQNDLPPATKGSGGGLLALLALAGAGFLVYRNGESTLRSLLLYLARAGWARSLVTGFPPAWAMARSSSVPTKSPMMLLG